MIYPPHFPEDYENIGEKRVYHALSALPADDYDVYFQKTFSGSGSRENDDYEIDFLIIDKRNDRFNAMLVIEVKGGKLTYSAKENCWFQNGHKLNPGPDGQARKNKHNLVHRFPSLLVNVPVGWVLWFPEGYNTAGDFTPVNMKPWQVLDFDSLSLFKESIDLAFEKIKGKYNQFAGESIDFYTTKLRTSLLRGLGIIQPLNIQLKRFDEQFLQLEREQKSFFASLYQIRKLAVSGGAGTGKTLLATSAAIDFGNEGKSVLFLCFNRMLALAMEATIANENITISTFHTFAYKRVEEQDSGWLARNPERGDEFHMRLLPDKFDEITTKNSLKKKYDVLIIDEAQDFEHTWLRTIFKYTHPKSQVILFFDENQNIFKRRFSIPGKDTFIPFKLNNNYRNTRKICDFVTRSTGIEITSSNTPVGIDAETIGYSDTEDLIGKVSRCVLSLVQIEKIGLQDILILIDGHVNDHPFASVSAIDRFKFKAWDINSPREPNELYFTSITRFKGLESNVVLLILNKASAAEEKKQFYTQCTRAKSVLKVFEKDNKV